MPLQYSGTGADPVVSSGSITAINSTPTGTASANSAVEIVLAGRGTLGIQVTGTYVGTLTIQVTMDGTNWATITNTSALASIITGALTANLAANGTGQFVIDVAGAIRARVSATAYTSGTAVVTLTGVSSQALVGLDAPLPAGSNALGSVSISGTPNVTANPPGATGTNLETAASTNALVVKATSGHLYMLMISNLTASTIYVKLYNKATAPTVGTDSPKMTIPVAAGAVWVADFGQIGMRFTAGIAVAVTGAAAKTDTTAVAAGALIDGTYL